QTITQEGETTALTLTEANDVFHFSDPEPGVSDFMEAWNDTVFIRDIAIDCFMNPGQSMHKPALYFNDVGHVISPLNVTAEFTPILRAYIASDYQKTQILQGAMDTPTIWERDVSAFCEEDTTRNLARDPCTAVYEIRKVY
ncbi:hypothetical protein DFH29DRAFT_795328, partial [Suillus ampliporus]